MADIVETFTDDNFPTKVEGSDSLTIVDFWAEWCAPCKMLGPIVVELADENQGSVSVGKLNVDENPQTASKFGIRGIPTILFFKNGEVKEQLVGVRPKTEIQAVIDKHK
jgi:thioredoxin 1